MMIPSQHMQIGVRSGLPEPRHSSQYNAAGAPHQHRFDPYAMNGGTILGIAGEDFCVIAADTRLSEGYSIHSRTETKILKMSSSTVLATGGFHGDALTFHKSLKWKCQTYQHDHQKEIGCVASAQMISTMLYYKRFFPYYCYNIVGGVDANGKGAVYSFDPVGSYEREEYRAGGTGSSLLQPLLDSELGKKNKQNVIKTPLTKEETINLVKDAFTGVAERDIYTGDCVEIQVITKDGVQVEMFRLRRD